MPVGHGGGGGGSHGGGFSGGHSGGSFGGHSGGFGGGGSHGGGFGGHSGGFGGGSHPGGFGGGPRPGGFGGGPRPGGFGPGPGGFRPRGFRPMPPYGGGGGGCGCGALLLVPILLVFLVLFSTVATEFSGCNRSYSSPMRTEPIYETVESETVVISTDEPLMRLDDSLCTETAYYHDAIGLITSEDDLLPGLQEFYKVTGVQPFVCLMDMETVEQELGATDLLTYDEAYDYAEQCYCELFHDEGHYMLAIFVYQQDLSDSCWVDVIGSDAVNVGPLHDEVLNQLEANVDTMLYDYEALGAEKQLSRIFSLTAQTLQARLGEAVVSKAEPSKSEAIESEPDTASATASEKEPVDEEPIIEPVIEPEDPNSGKKKALVVGGSIALIVVVVFILITTRANRRKIED